MQLSVFLFLIFLNVISQEKENKQQLPHPNLSFLKIDKQRLVCAWSLSIFKNVSPMAIEWKIIKDEVRSALAEAKISVYFFICSVLFF